MADLQDQFISDSFPSLLHVHRPTGVPDGALPTTGVGLIEDGSGNNSALLLGRLNQGATILGNLSVIGDNNKIIGDSTTIRADFCTLSGIVVNRITGVNNVIQGVNTLNGNTTINGGTFVVNSGITTINSSTIYSRTISANDLKVGNISYPNLGGTSTANKFLQMNSTGLVIGFADVNPGDVVNTNPDIITQTVYVNNPYSTGSGTSVPTFTINGDGATWTSVALPGFDDASGYKAGIFYLEPATSLRAELAYSKIIASPNGNATSPRIFPVSLTFSSEEAGSGSGTYGNGTQFHCPVTDGKLWFRKDTSVARARDDSSDDVWKLYIIARQK